MKNRALKDNFDFKEAMNTSLQTMRKNRLEKYNHHAEFFTLSLNSFKTFLTKLKQHPTGLTDETRFQIAVTDEESGEWWMVDCYIHNNHLNTFTIASNRSSKAINATSICRNLWPLGVHSSCHRNIAATIDQSMALTRKHISIVSKIEPQNLYGMLSKNRLPQTLVDKIKKSTIKYNVQNAGASIVGDFNVKQEGPYLPFFAGKKKFTNDRSGFGFITMPALLIVKDLMLDETNFINIQNTAQVMIEAFKTFPRYRKAIGFIRAKHADKTDDVIDQIKALLKTEKNKDRFIQKLFDIISAYAGYLDKHKSERTLLELTETVGAIRSAYLGLDTIKTKKFKLS